MQVLMFGFLLVFCYNMKSISNFFQSMNFELLILSFIQGIGELLPISSSINLYFFSTILHISSFNFSLKIALHAGNLIAIIFYFRKEIILIFRAFFASKIKLSETYFYALFFGTIPVVVSSFWLKDYAEHFNSNFYLGITNCIFGLILLIIDFLCPNNIKKRNAPVSAIKSFFIGCAQIIAIFPGVSRLGVCITASRLLGIDRKKAIYFSLMLAIPSIIGAIILELFNCSHQQQSTNWLYSKIALEAIVITALISLLTIKLFVSYMERHNFVAISIYRLIIGTLICLI